MPVADVAINSAIKYLDSQFNTSLDFTKSDSFDSTSAPTDQSSVSALSNKYSPSVPVNVTLHADLPAINTFQTTQSSKQNLPSSNVSSVLSQNSKVGYCLVIYQCAIHIDLNIGRRIEFYSCNITFEIGFSCKLDYTLI